VPLVYRSARLSPACAASVSQCLHCTALLCALYCTVLYCITL
jgi:hypothetical protein